MTAQHAIADWHLDVTLIQATLRRYSGQDAQAAYEARAPYDAIVTADIRGLSAELHGMLVLPPPLTRADRRVIETLLRKVGATSCTAERGGTKHEMLATR